MPKRRLFAIVTILLLSSSAWASPISFIYTGVGSGSLGPLAFSDAAFTITASADTDDRQHRNSGNGFFINHTSVAIDIAGLGSANFLTGTRTFVNNDIASVGFSLAGSSGWDLYDSFDDPAYGAWDMLSAIGPIAGSFDLLQWDDSPVNTDLGTLSFVTALTAGSFQATTAVPEPATAILIPFAAAAFSAVFGARRRSKFACRTSQ